MRVLIACEWSQEVTAAFRALGHDAFSCDYKPAAINPEWHIRADARTLLNEGWDKLIAHPPCDRLANSGVTWLKKRRLWAELDKACALFLDFWNAPIPQIAIENPIPHAYAIDIIGRKYDQVVQPHFFGVPQFKATCLWLKGLKPLQRTHHMELPKPGTPEYTAWSSCHRAPDSRNRKDVRAKTHPGVAQAFALQWGTA